MIGCGTVRGITDTAPLRVHGIEGLRAIVGQTLEPKAGGQLGRFALAFEVGGVAKPVCAATALILFT